MLSGNEVHQPALKRRISTYEILQGTAMIPANKVKVMSSGEYEEYTLEWLFGAVKNKYVKVRAFTGAGDKGRDIVAYYPDDSVDIYQCKHYDERISPTTLYTELGKLCYYTYNHAYPTPNSYFIVAPQGCGPTVLDLINSPEKINDELIDAWEKNCLKKITRTKDVVLEGDFLEYIKNFNFSIVKDVAPHEVLEQHSQTPYHALRFGGGIKKFREVIPVPDKEIQMREQKYITALFSVYQEKLGVPIAGANDLHQRGGGLNKHFNTQRNSFYSCESLEKFGRENFAEAETEPFQELKEDAETIISNLLLSLESKSGFERLTEATTEIMRQTFTSNPLHFEIRPLDKGGLCHHLVNEEKIQWIITTHEQIG
jgi:hypothetical protein